MVDSIRENSDAPNERTEMSELSVRLTSLGYIELFHRLDESAIDEIWNRAGARDALRRLAVDADAPEPARFLAAEILFYKQPDYPLEEAKVPLASVYEAALRQNWTEMANSWGLPGSLDGLAGQHFVALGAAALPTLAALLDEEARLIYSGSQEATFGNRYQYRVKDAAAFFISRILGVPFQVHESPKARDEEIERLRASLK